MSHDFSLILWLVMALVAVLSGHVGLAWLAKARRRPSLVLGWKAQLVAAVTLGTGVNATALLGLTNEVVKFPIGYGAVAAPVLWLGSVILSLPMVAALSFSRRSWAVVLGASLMTLVAVFAQAGWIWAAGFRPGVRWNFQLLAAASAVMLVGFACALWVLGQQRRSSRIDGEAKDFMPLGMALLMGLSLVVGQQLVMGSSDLHEQYGSVYRNQLPGTIISLSTGALVPLTLSIMSIDLVMRRQRPPRGSTGLHPQKRRKRRHRVRQI
jgi:NO-binding membrane sensor protein with MHYT domain